MSTESKPSLRALIVIAHGSRREATGTEFRATVELVAQRISDIYGFVEPAFLDCMSPTLAEATALLVKKGAINIDVYPFFLNTGRHADEDIPRLVAELDAEYPTCHVAQFDYLGKSVELAGFVENHIRAQGCDRS